MRPSVRATCTSHTLYLIHETRVLSINLFWMLSLPSHGWEQTHKPVIVTTLINGRKILCEAAATASAGPNACVCPSLLMAGVTGEDRREGTSTRTLIRKIACPGSALNHVPEEALSAVPLRAA